MEKKWYAAEYNERWAVEDQNSNDILDCTEVGKEQARRNAYLAANAPEWKEIAGMFYEAATDNVVDVRSTIYKYEQLIQKEDGNNIQNEQ